MYFQAAHLSGRVCARAFLEGRLTEEQMNNFRQEVHGKGLSPYPHPKLMPEFWQFPDRFVWVWAQSGQFIRLNS